MSHTRDRMCEQVAINLVQHAAILLQDHDRQVKIMAVRAALMDLQELLTELNKD